MNSLRLLNILFILNSCFSDARFQYEDVDRLVAHLFNTTRYKKNIIRPVRDQSKSTQVNISLTLQGIKEFDLTSGSMISTGNLIISWYDELLVWVPAEFGGIEKLKIPDGYNWKPGLAFAKSLDEESLTGSKAFAPSWVTHNGNVRMLSAGHFQTICETDTTHYPLDAHSCNYQIISTDYDTTEVMLYSTDRKINFDDFTDHGEWFIVDSVCKQETTNKKTNTVQVSMLSNIIFVKRRSGFVLLHALLPLFLLDALCIVVCLVPVDSGERISYSVTVFLSFVFLSDSIVSDLPHNSLKIPALSFELCVVNILSTLNVLWSVYIVRLSRRRGEVSDLPRFLRRLSHIINRTSKTISDRKMNCKRLRSRKDSENKEDLEGSRQDLKGEEIEFDEQERLWQETVKALDMAYFILNLSLYIIMGLTMIFVFLSGYMNQSSQVYSLESM